MFVEAAVDTRPAAVHLLPWRGQQRVLDSGAIAAGSLALSHDGRRVYWIKDGIAGSAAITGAAGTAGSRR